LLSIAFESDILFGPHLRIRSSPILTWEAKGQKLYISVEREKENRVFGRLCPNLGRKDGGLILGTILLTLSAVIRLFLLFIIEVFSFSF
jgi:hypothetical protein